MDTGEISHSHHQHNDGQQSQQQSFLAMQFKRRSSNEIDSMHSSGHMDSGYTSALSYNLTGTSTSTFSPSLQSSSSVRRQYELGTIEEGREQHYPKATTFETPTTRSAREIDNFHISTPPVQQFRAQNETTPTKAYTNPFQCSLASPHTKRNGDALMTTQAHVKNIIPTSALVAANRTQKTPQKRNVSFSDKLNSVRSYSSSGSMLQIEEEPMENDENSFDGNQMNASIPISPINKSNVGILTESPRHVIDTSTPKRPINRPSTKTIAKCQRITSSPKRKSTFFFFMQ